MGVMKFKLPSNEPAQRTPEYRKAYITGLDRTPGRLAVELRNGLMSCVRDTPESGRLFVPWPIEGHGMPIVGTATLAERVSPYTLAVELARGKLNDIRNQLSDWLQMGLARRPSSSKHWPRRSMRSSDAPPRRIGLTIATRPLEPRFKSSSRAGDLLIEAYTAQISRAAWPRRPGFRRTWAAFSTLLPQKIPAAIDWSSAFNTCHMGVSWKQVAPSEGQYRWDLLDAQLAWCRSKGLTFEVGPLIDFRPGGLPDWIWLWEGDARRSAAWRLTSSARSFSAIAAGFRCGTWFIGPAAAISWA